MIKFQIVLSTESYEYVGKYAANTIYHGSTFGSTVPSCQQPTLQVPRYRYFPTVQGYGTVGGK